ncbi:zinc metalloprotease [Portibacter lacus]|nr:hypothetical protein [Portibacter lacus]
MTNFYKTIIAKAIALLLFSFNSSDLNPFINLSKNMVEIPVMDVNFYMMNRSDVDAATLGQIRENVRYLNEEFEQTIIFEVNHFFINEGHAYLPDLHKEYFGVEELTIDSLVENIEDQGSINIYIFDSYVIQEMNAELMGFTPIFRASHKDYADASPSFDRIFLAYSALEKKTTLVHEMGHFLGLDHPWEMSDINKDLMGLSEKSDISENHMAYGPSVDGFTSEQLERMQHFAKQFRAYLINRKEFVFQDVKVTNL